MPHSLDGVSSQGQCSVKIHPYNMRRASFTNRAQDITHTQIFTSDDISQTSPTRLNASLMNTLVANPRLISTMYQGIIPDQVSSGIAQQSCGLKQLSCATHEDQDDQLLHTELHISFIYFDIHTSFCMYTLSTLGDSCLRITSFRSSPFPSEFESQSQFPSLFSIISSLSLVSTAFSLHCICILYCVSLHVLFVLLRLLHSHVIASSFPAFSLQFSAFSDWLCSDRISAQSCDTKALVSSPFPSCPYRHLIGILVPSPFLVSNFGTFAAFLL